MDKNGNLREGYTTHLTHSNHAKSLLVCVREDLKEVHVYRMSAKVKQERTDAANDATTATAAYSVEEEKTAYKEFMQKVVCEHVFVGETPKKRASSQSSNGAVDFHGNSILVKLKDNQYIFITDQIRRFSTKNDVISTFTLAMGKNGLPYPIAVGEKNYYSLGDELLYLAKSEFPDTVKDDMQLVYNLMKSYHPFMFNLTGHVKNTTIMSLDAFRVIQDTPLDEILDTTVKELAELFKVPPAESAKVLVDRIESLRDTIVYNKKGGKKYRRLWWCF
jgi:hypothetical protein